MKSSEVTIGAVCELINGRAFKPSDWSADGLPIVRIQNLNDENAPFNRYNGPVRDRFLIDSGALLFSWSGTPGTSFGAFFWQRGPAILNQHIFQVLPRDGVDKNYLRYALNGRIQSIIAQAHGGVGLQHITKDKLEATTIPLPPLPEQRRIADILDKADAIRRKRKEAIALTEELLRSAFLEMFGDPVTNPKGWPTRGIEELCECIVDCVNRTAPTVDYETPYKMIRTTNVKSGRVLLDDVKYVSQDTFEIWNRRCTPSPGDVLLTREAPVGEAGLLLSDEQIFLGQRLMLYRPNLGMLLPDYLVQSFLGQHLQNQFTTHGSGSTVKHLSLPVCRSLSIRLPPLAEQKRFADAAIILRRKRMRYERALRESEELFQSLVNRAFSVTVST